LSSDAAPIVARLSHYLMRTSFRQKALAPLADIGVCRPMKGAPETWSRSGAARQIGYTRQRLPILEETSMAVLKIRDLADSVELDRQAMHTIVGGARDGLRPSFRIRPASNTNRVVDYPGVPVKDVPAVQTGPFTTKIVTKK
jgi:hypothetical protein